MLIRSILCWKNCTRAEALVHISRAKIERINTVARHVLLQGCFIVPRPVTDPSMFWVKLIPSKPQQNTTNWEPSSWFSWWRHQMETFSALLAICAGNSPVSGEFPAQRPATRSFDVFFDLRLINGWVNNREAGDLRQHRAHYRAQLLTTSAHLITSYGLTNWPLGDLN